MLVRDVQPPHLNHGSIGWRRGARQPTRAADSFGYNRKLVSAALNCHKCSSCQVPNASVSADSYPSSVLLPWYRPCSLWYCQASVSRASQHYKVKAQEQKKKDSRSRRSVYISISLRKSSSHTVLWHAEWLGSVLWRWEWKYWREQSHTCLFYYGDSFSILTPLASTSTKKFSRSASCSIWPATTISEPLNK